jgi:hypothetical protein
MTSIRNRSHIENIKYHRSYWNHNKAIHHPTYVSNAMIQPTSTLPKRVNSNDYGRAEASEKI